MLYKLNKYLVILLALLQTLTPLAHAHAGKNDPHQGLHIPGLESFHFDHDAPILANVNKTTNAEGMLVMIEAGIKNPYTVIPNSREIDFASLTETHLALRSLPESDQNFSPQPFQTNFSSLYFTPHSPRAPPYSISYGKASH